MRALSRHRLPAWLVAVALLLAPAAPWLGGPWAAGGGPPGAQVCTATGPGLSAPARDGPPPAPQAGHGPGHCAACAPSAPLLGLPPAPGWLPVATAVRHVRPATAGTTTHGPRRWGIAHPRAPPRRG